MGTSTDWLTGILVDRTYGRLAIKGGVRVVATTNQALAGLPTIDGVTLVEGDAALLTAQTLPQQNGVWAVSSGGWTRRSDTTQGGLLDSIIKVREGTSGAGQIYTLANTAEPTLDADPQTWSLFSPVSTSIVAQGAKLPVVAATTAGLPANTYTTTAGGTITANANGAWSSSSSDGASLATGDRLLVKDETTGAHNGIYVLTSAGGASAPWVLTRASDANTSALVTTSMVVSVQQGTKFQGSAFVLVTLGPITLGTTSLKFIRANATMDPRLFGADPTGAADSTAAILACANAVNALGGGRVQFAEGTYLITTLTLSSLIGVALCGAARYGTRLVIADASLGVDNVVLDSANTVEFTDFALEHQSDKNKTGGAWLKIVAGDQVYIDRLRIVGPWKGIEVNGKAHGGIHIGKHIKFFPGTGTDLQWHSAIWLRNAAGIWCDDIDINFGYTVALLYGGFVVDSNVDTLKVHATASNQVGTPSLPNTNGGHAFRLLNSWEVDPAGIKIAVASAATAQTYNATDFDGRLGKLGELDPRHLTFTTTGADSNFVDGSKVTFHGLDQNGNAYSEAVTLATASSPGTFTTTGLFTRIDQIVVDAQGTHTDGTISFGVAVVVNTDVGATEAPFPPRWLTFVDCTAEAVAGHGWLIESCNQLTVINGTAASSTNGVLINGGNDIVFVAGFYINNANHGIEIQGGKRITFIQPHSTGNSSQATNTYDNIAVGAGDSVRIIEPVCGDTDTIGAVGWSARYNIHLTGGTNIRVTHPTYGSLVATGNFVDATTGPQDIQQLVRTEGMAAPVAGTWTAGSVVFNNAPSDGAPGCWIGVGGSPGTWLKMYATSLSAPTSAATVSSIMARASDGTTTVAALNASTTAQYGSLGATFFPSGVSGNAAGSGVIRTEKSALTWTYRDTAGTQHTGLQIDGADHAILGNTAIEQIIDGLSIVLRDTAGNQTLSVQTSGQGMVHVGQDGDSTHTNLRINGSTQTTVGAAGAASALPATPSIYLVLDINGTEYVFPGFAKI